jgi:NitT/TauT family transport system substrate-binding protein
MPKRIQRRTFLTQSVAAAAVAGTGMNAARGQDNKLLPLRIGILKIASSTNLWAAKQAGIFEKNGLDVQFLQFRSGNEAIAAQRGGHVDVVLSIPGTAMTANERGFNLVLVSQSETAHKQGPDSGALIVLKDSGINSVADLAGKKIALSNVHSQKYVCDVTLLKKYGVDRSKVTFLEIPYSSHPAVLRSKQIDVSACLDPWTTVMRTSSYAKVIAWDYVDTIPEQPIGGWYARADFVREHREAVDRFARSSRDSIDYINADVERARKYVAAFTGLKASLVEDMPLIKWSYEIDPAKWQAVVDMMHESGQLQRPHKASEYLSDIVKPYIKT